MLAEKRQLADELIDGDGEVGLTELPDDELLGCSSPPRGSPMVPSQCRTRLLSCALQSRPHVRPWPRRPPDGDVPDAVELR